MESATSDAVDADVAPISHSEPEEPGHTNSLETSAEQTPATQSTQDRSDNDNQLESSFSGDIARYRCELDEDYQFFASSIQQNGRDKELEEMDWNDLEDRYDAAMAIKIQEEQEIFNDISARFKQFVLWLQTSNEKEAERALKRLRTRVAFVQNSEDQLATKQQHYTKVLAAFQEAMALLGNL